MSGDLLDAIAAGDLRPVYYLCGEAYPRDRAVAALREAVLAGDANAFNYDAMRAKDVGAAGILAAARTMPMLGPRRLVQVRDAHELKADELNLLLPYVEDPAPFTVLVLVGDKADLRLKFFARCKKEGVVQRFEPLKERQVPKWVAGEARRAGIKLEPGAAERIGDAVGTDMGQLASALERLALYVGERSRVRIADVEELLAQTRQRSIFELTNAVGRGQRREAMLVLRQMVQAREPAIRIVAMLARHLRQLWGAKELAAAGLPQKEIAAEIGIHPFFLKDLLAQARRFEPSALRSTHRALFDVDRQLKSSRLPDSAVLDRLVIALVGGSRGGGVAQPRGARAGSRAGD